MDSLPPGWTVRPEERRVWNRDDVGRVDGCSWTSLSQRVNRFLLATRRWGPSFNLKHSVLEGATVTNETSPFPTILSSHLVSFSTTTQLSFDFSLCYISPFFAFLGRLVLPFFSLILFSTNRVTGGKSATPSIGSSPRPRPKSPIPLTCAYIDIHPTFSLTVSGSLVTNPLELVHSLNSIFHHPVGFCIDRHAHHTIFCHAAGVANGCSCSQLG